MKQLEMERSYSDPVASHTGPLQTKLGAVAVFCAITIGTFLVISMVTSLKYGVWNALFIVIGVLGMGLIAAALPGIRENASYLWPRLNRWHLVWYGIYVSSLVFRIRALAEFREQPVDGWAMLRIGPEGIIGFYLLFLLAARKLPWVGSMFTGVPKVLTLYTAFCLVSSIWSVFPPWTIYKSMEYTLDIAVISALLCIATDAEKYKTLLDFTWTVYAIEAFWCWCQIGIWPGEVLDDGRLKGIWPLTGYNALGEYGALLCVVAFARLVPLAKFPFKRSWYLMVFAFGFLTLLAANTRNTIGGLAAALVLILIISRGLSGPVIFGLSGAGIVFAALSSAIKTFLKRGQTDAAFDSLSGRLEWWKIAWVYFVEHPIGGLGAYAAGKFAVMKSLNANTGSTHSDYIELLVGTGIVGTVLFAIAIIWSWYLLLKYSRDVSCSPLERQLSMESFGVMTVLVVHSFFNVELIWHAPLFYFVVLGCAEMIRRRKVATTNARLRMAQTWA
ncbi:MAG: O-antigen ligase family protein [Terriglobales bacterium]|jgi:O-antigen ligase